MSNIIKGVGCDIVDIARIERMVGKTQFIQKVYTTCEQAYILGKPICTAAGIWAAKEAVCKALGTGFTGFRICDIEICQEASGKPYVHLYKGAQNIFEALGGSKIHLSISHEQKQAMAFAVIE